MTKFGAKSCNCVHLSWRAPFSRVRVTEQIEYDVTNSMALALALAMAMAMALALALALALAGRNIKR